MKKNNESGFLQLIVCILIFLVFSITLYACLDILNLIDAPEGYSVSDWLSRFSKDVVIEQYNAEDDTTILQNITKKVRVEVDKATNTYEDSSSTAPVINEYSASQTSTTSYSSNYSSGSYTYYNQLDDTAKVIYNGLAKNLDNMKSGNYNVSFGTTFNDLLNTDGGEQKLNDSFQLAINALNFDNPELFYFDISKIYLLTKITTKLWSTTYEVEVGSSQGQSYLNQSFNSSADVNQAIQRINSIKSDIESRATGSTENKIKVVHDYLVDNLEYDGSVSNNNIYNIYGALVNRLTVCEGYARAFKAIMDDLNIPCVLVCGTAVNSAGQGESHAWNYVQIDGNWYAIDVTWDDPVIVGSGYVSNDVKYRYYLKGSNEFFTNHTEDGNIVGNANFRYPTISVSNY